MARRIFVKYIPALASLAILLGILAFVACEPAKCGQGSNCAEPPQTDAGNADTTKADCTPGAAGCGESGPSWAYAAGGPENDSGRAVVVDSKGDVYFGGFFNGSAKFGDTTLNANGTSRSGFLVKMSATGEFIWAKVVSGDKGGAVLGLALAKDGDILATGEFNGTMKFGDKELVSKGQEGYVAAFKADGTVSWLQSYGGGGTTEAYAIAVGADGSIAIAGYFSGTGEFGGKEYKTTGDRDVFAAKLDNKGAVQWAATGGSTERDQANGVVMDSKGNVYIVGAYGSGGTANEATFGDHKVMSIKDSDIFIAMLDNTGKFAWAFSAGSDVWDNGYGIAIDKQDKVYATGRFHKEVKFGDITLTATGLCDVFVLHIDATGKVVWAVKGGSKGTYDEGHALTTDANGFIYLTGSISKNAIFGDLKVNGTGGGSYDIVTLKLDNKGKFLASEHSYANKFEWGYAIATDGKGGVFVTGHFDVGDLMVKGKALKHIGKQDVYYYLHTF